MMSELRIVAAVYDRRKLTVVSECGIAFALFKWHRRIAERRYSDRIIAAVDDRR